MTDEPIFLDHNAGAPVLPEVADAVREAARRFPGNPASQHALGRAARRALETARQRIGELLGADLAGRPGDQVVLTSGGTEGNNLALFGLEPPDRAARTVAVSAIEHPSVARAAQQLEARGATRRVLPVDRHGVVEVAAVDELPAGPSTLVSVMLANNDTGVLQPVAEIARRCRATGRIVHTDAVQAVGKIAVDFHALSVDAMTVTAHKFHGPRGIGALLVRGSVSLAPQLWGGFQQQGLRPGTECAALAIGFVAALEAWRREAEQRQARMTGLRDELERLLCAGDSRAVVIGAAASRLPHTANVAFAGVDRQALVMALDQVGVACATGSACASGSSEPSATLVAMGLPEAWIRGSLRFSLGALTTAAEVAQAARRILLAVKRL